jgi:8-oxo-dGTP pyrophosphatase MutT (NUDIX family)
MSKRAPVKRAAVIPYFINDGIIEMMFMQPSDSLYGGPDPQISKGKVDPTDESIEAAAFREAHEELGLKATNIKNQDFIGTILGNTDLWIAEVHNKTDFDPFHYETVEVYWLTNEEFKNRGRVLHIDIVDMVDSIIREKL